MVKRLLYQDEFKGIPNCMKTKKDIFDELVDDNASETIADEYDRCFDYKSNK